MSATLQIDPNIRDFLSKAGRKGGLCRSRRLSSTERRAVARCGAIAKWMKNRFGVLSFREMELPGWEIVDKGLNDLAAEHFDEMEALAVAELAPRLKFLNVPVPRAAETIENPRMKLYEWMESKHGGMDYPRFLAALERLDSFCDSLEVFHTRFPATRRSRLWCK